MAATWAPSATTDSRASLCCALKQLTRRGGANPLENLCSSFTDAVEAAVSALAATTPTQAVAPAGATGATGATGADGATGEWPKREGFGVVSCQTR
jgi:hypothetical protein